MTKPYTHPLYVAKRQPAYSTDEDAGEEHQDNGSPGGLRPCGDQRRRKRGFSTAIING